jgi:glycosyltransferase involved in cell wall biosynthesis
VNNYRKEDAFVSVVMVVKDDERIIENQIRKILYLLDNNFNNYEIIVVDNNSKDSTLKIIQNLGIRLTTIELSRKHNLQDAFNAGIDATVGDFIFEIRNINTIDKFDIFYDLYRKSSEGNDFVFYTSKTTKLSSKIYYRIINDYFKEKISSKIFSPLVILSSRRGQNKIFESGNVIINRELSYLLTGLNSIIISGDIKYKETKNTPEKIDLFINTLIYYTNIIPNVASFITVFFSFASIVFFIFSIAAYFLIKTVDGWASTNAFIAFSFSGVFLMMAIVLKYLSNIINISKKTKSYSYKSINKY